MARLPAIITFADLRLSHRDRRILERAMWNLGEARVEFGEAIRTLREATEELIVDGRVFVLGTCALGPIVGSVVSRVGIVEREAGIQIVRVQGVNELSHLGWFSR